jgi:hypothetical protein
LIKAKGNTFTLEQLKDWTALFFSAADDLDYLFDRFAGSSLPPQSNVPPSKKMTIRAMTAMHKLYWVVCCKHLHEDGVYRLSNWDEPQTEAEVRRPVAGFKYVDSAIVLTQELGLPIEKGPRSITTS